MSTKQTKKTLLRKYKAYDDRGRIKIGAFSDFLIEAYHLCSICGCIYMYDDTKGSPTEGLYLDAGNLEEQMLDYIPDSIENTRKEILKQIKLKKNKMPVLTNTTMYSHLIAFKNGVYNIRTNTLLPFSPDYIITNKVPHNYDPDAYSEIVDTFLEKVCDGDEEVKETVIQMFGYSMRRDLKEQVAFILFGPGGNGKSVLQGCLTTMLGAENVSGVDIRDLSNDKFAAADLMGKLANISDDISGEYINDPATFKSITTGERLRAQKKFQDAFDFKSYATMIFSANKLPRIKDADGGVRRRLLIIPFTHKFTASDPDYDPYIADKLFENSEEYDIETNMSYLINLGIKGLNHIKQQGGFTISKKSEIELDKYDKECNPILQWAEEFLETGHDDNGMVSSEVAGPWHDFDLVPRRIAYDDYKLWCADSNNKAMSKKPFTDFICERYDMKCENHHYKGTGKTEKTFLAK